MYGSVYGWGEFCSSPAFICVAIAFFLAVCFFVSMIVATFLPELEERRSVKLALINSVGNSASFLHGIGAGSQSLYQFYAVQEDGAMVLQTLPPDFRVTIYEDRELHDTATLTAVFRKQDRSKWWANFALPNSWRYRYEFRLPVGSVLHTNPNFRVRLDS